MKIEQTFKDSKGLLNIEKVMNKRREQLESTLALMLLAYGVGLMIGEAARDEAYGGEVGEKGGCRREGNQEVEALLRTVCFAEEAASFHGEAMASGIGRSTGVMETALVPALVQRCLISCPKVRIYSLAGLYNPPMPYAEAPEFDLGRPLPSAVAVIRAVLFSPKKFYLNFSAGGPVKEPTVFVLLVAAVTGVLTAAVALLSGLIFGEVGVGELVLTVLEAAVFTLLSPLAVGAVAGVYLLSIRTFVGKTSSFREVYRMAAYAFGALILAWIPLIGAFVVTYALMVLMGLGVRFVYRTSLLTAVVTALVGFVPISVALIWLRIMTAGLASG